MSDTGASWGRRAGTIMLALVLFAIIAVLFFGIDLLSGMRMPSQFAFALVHPSTATHTPTTTPTPRSRATPTIGVSSTATITATPAIPGTPQPTTTPLTATATPIATSPGGVSPPIYGIQPNYTNNTTFNPDYLRRISVRIIALTNQQRVAHGLTPLVESLKLDVLAAARSQDMVKRQYFDHFDPTGAVDSQGRRPAAVQELLMRNTVPYTEVGENLVGNTGFPLNDATPDQVVNAWMNHPEHRDNILHPGYSLIGVGIAAENQSNGLRVVITQIFIR